MYLLHCVDVEHYRSLFVEMSHVADKKLLHAWVVLVGEKPNDHHPPQRIIINVAAIDK